MPGYGTKRKEGEGKKRKPRSKKKKEMKREGKDWNKGLGNASDGNTRGVPNWPALTHMDKIS